MNETAHGKVWCERGEPKMEPGRTVIFHSWLYYGCNISQDGLAKENRNQPERKEELQAWERQCFKKRRTFNNAKYPVDLMVQNSWKELVQ